MAAQESSWSAASGTATMKVCRGRRFLGVRWRPAGRWIAEIKDSVQCVRMWLGTFDTAEDVACTYDEVARALRGDNTRTNFAARHGATVAAPARARLSKNLQHVMVNVSSCLAVYVHAHVPSMHAHFSSHVILYCALS